LGISSWLLAARPPIASRFVVAVRNLYIPSMKLNARAMAAFTVSGSHQGPCVAALHSGHKHSFCNDPLRRSNVVPTVACSMNSDARRMKLNAQGPNKWRPQMSGSNRLFESDIDLHPFAPSIHLDLLGRIIVHPSLSEKRKVVVADQRKRRLKAFHQRARDFADGLMDHILSSNENYKYVIEAIRENAILIMEQGFVSPFACEEILYGLERIEKDIEENRFDWKNGVDIRTNIMEALIEQVGPPAKRLDATISHYLQQLRVLQIWFCDSINKIVAQIKELQIELILLALRNEGLVLPCIQGRAKWILLGNLVLSKLVQLETDVSQLLRCKNNMDYCKTKMDSSPLMHLPWRHTEDSKNSLSKDRSGYIYASVINFRNVIIGDISQDLSSLERDLASWREWDLLTPNDTVTTNGLLMNKYMLDLDKFTAVRSAYSIYNAVQDSSKQFLAIYKIIPEILKAARDFAKSSSFSHGDIKSFPSASLCDSLVVRLRASMEPKQDQSDDTRRKLLDWLHIFDP
ncbi:hypothetical protein EJB05_53113, partial [Eragrostis curvula]